jgi:hypothetical protein
MANIVSSAPNEMAYNTPRHGDLPPFITQIRMTEPRDTLRVAH